MTRLALRGLVQRPLRTALTALAIVLGVAMVSAAFTVTDTMRSAADSLSTAAYKGTDAVVTAPVAFGNSIDSNIGGAQPIPASALARVRAVPGVGVATGDILENAKLVGRDGKTIGTGPYFGIGLDSRIPGAQRLSPFRLTQGRWATGPSEVVVDPGTMSKEHYRLGDRIRINTSGPARTFTIVGSARFGKVDRLGTATTAVFDLRTAQQLFNRRGSFDDILVAAKPGVTPVALRRDLQRSLGSQFAVRSAEKQDRFTLDGLKQFISILKAILLALGGVAIVVGAFTIFNALAITVAQRTRELALARAMGASRGQVVRSVGLEALVMALVASAIGTLAGLGLAKGITSLFTAFGMDLPSASTSLAGRTVIVAMAVGLITTLLAGLVPAVRATRIAPVEAMREGTVEHGHIGRKRMIVAAGGIGLGLAILAYGLFGGGMTTSERLIALAPGTLLLLLGVAAGSARAVSPLTTVVGWPARRLGGVAGQLASCNAQRNPGRTAATAAALMVGLALVTFVGVLGSGVRASTVGALNHNLHSQYVVVGSDGFSEIDPAVSRAAAKVPGVQSVATMRQRDVLAFGSQAPLDGVTPAAFARAYSLSWKDGSQSTLASLSGDGAIVRAEYATKHHLNVGDRFSITTQNAKHLSLVVRGIESTPAMEPLGRGPITIALDTFKRTFPPTQDRMAFIAAAPGVSLGSLTHAIHAYPSAKAWTPGAYAKDQGDQINQLLGILYVMLALAVVVSLFGIITTLALSVVERTRELGLLRAVGATRRQVRRSVRHEGVVVSLIGAILGMGVGLVLAGLVTKALSNVGMRFSVPVGSLLAFLIVAALAGVIAAVLPARRAARLNVLGALAHE